MTALSGKLTCMGKKDRHTFGSLFRIYRLKAGFATLTQFGEALAEAGKIVEDSTLSRWQNGSRIPQTRQVVLTIIQLFCQHHGITTLAEANRLMEVAGQGYLTEKESQNPLSKLLPPPNHFQVPADITYFTGRTALIEKLEKQLVNKKPINLSIHGIYGLGGIGKTALAIRLAHGLRPYFPDGVLWSRVDTSGPLNILAKIAYTYGEDISRVKDLSSRAELVRSLLADKHALLIFDNVPDAQTLVHLLPNTPSCSVIITSRNQEIRAATTQSICLDTFSDEEAKNLFMSILGKKAASGQGEVISQLNRLVGGLPLALQILGRQAREDNLTFPQLLARLRQAQLDYLEKGEMHPRASFELSFQGLPKTAQRVFISLGVFAGMDFSLDATAALHACSRPVIEKALQSLGKRSLVESSSDNRYRLHPLVKLFAEEKITHPHFHRRALDYFVHLINRCGPKGDTSQYPALEQELGNILPLLDYAYRHRCWQTLVASWEILGTFLWDAGYWQELETLGHRVCSAAEKLGDKKTEAACRIQELAWMYFWQGKLDKTSAYIRQGMKLAKQINNAYLVAYGQQKLGYLLFGRKKYSQALKQLQAALKTFTELKNPKRTLDTLTYLGHLPYKTGDTQKAKAYYLKALTIAQKINDQLGTGILYTNLGNIAQMEGKFTTARQFIRKSQRLDEALNRRDGSRTWNKYRLAQLNQAERKFSQAETQLQEVIKEFSQLGMHWVAKEAHLVLQQVQKRKTINPPLVW